jgi:hypothetical protein
MASVSEKSATGESNLSPITGTTCFAEPVCGTPHHAARTSPRESPGHLAGAFVCRRGDFGAGLAEAVQMEAGSAHARGTGELVGCRSTAGRPNALSPRRCTRSKNSTCATGQTSKPISATRPPTRGIWRFAGTEKKLDEVPHYFVFVAWACRLLPH